MDVMEAIRTRRSIPRVDPQRRPPRELIEELLELATWAPNHKRTQPWRFLVIAGQERLGLGQALQAALRQSRGVSPEKIAAAPQKPLRAPVIIAVSARPGCDALQTRENLMAVAAGIQNILLGVHARGLGAIWRTGVAAYSREVACWLGLEQHEQLLGLIYLGYAASEGHAGRTLSAADCTTWRGWD